MLELQAANLTPSQRELMRGVLTTDSPLYLWTGAIRSGKGVGAALAMITLAIRNAARGLQDAVYVLGGVTQTSFLNNNENYLIECAEQAGLRIKFDSLRKQFSLPDIGAKMNVYGGDNRRSFNRLRGLTAHSAWIDEATLVDESFFDTAVQRCSYADSRVIVTNNADAPQHWLRTNHILPIQRGDRAGTIIETDFAENAYYSDERRRELLSLNPHTTDYQRALENRWVNAEGLIIPVLDEHITDRAFDSLLGVCAIDDGTAGVTAAILLQRDPKGGWIARDEYYHDGARLGRLTLRQHLTAIRTRWQIARLIIDPAAAGMRAEATAMGMPALYGRNAFMAGVNAVNNALYSGKLRIHRDCVNLLLELSGYRWNAQGSAPIVGCPDHAADALRYGVMNVLPMHSSILLR